MGNTWILDNIDSVKPTPTPSRSVTPVKKAPTPTAKPTPVQSYVKNVVSSNLKTLGVAGDINKKISESPVMAPMRVTHAGLGVVGDILSRPLYGFGSGLRGAYQGAEKTKTIQGWAKGGAEGYKKGITGESKVTPGQYLAEDVLKVKNPLAKAAIQLPTDLVADPLNALTFGPVRKAIGTAIKPVIKGVEMVAKSKPVQKAVQFAKETPGLYKPIEVFNPGFRNPRAQQIISEGADTSQGVLNNLMHEVTTAFKGTSHEDQLRIGQMIEGKAVSHPDPKIAAKLRSVADTFIAKAEELGQELVRQKQLTPEQFSQFRGKYMAHVFEDAMKELHPSGGSGVMGGFTKQRKNAPGYVHEAAPATFLGLGREAQAVEKGKVYEKLGKEFGVQTPEQIPMQDLTNSLMNELLINKPKVRAGLGETAPGVVKTENMADELLDVFKENQPAHNIPSGVGGVPSTGGEIKVYRGIEAGDKRVGINAGDYVTTDKKVAQYYAGKGGKVIEQVVPQNRITAGETAKEFFYTPDLASTQKAQQYFQNNPTLKQFSSVGEIPKGGVGMDVRGTVGKVTGGQEIINSGFTDVRAAIESGGATGTDRQRMIQVFQEGLSSPIEETKRIAGETLETLKKIGKIDDEFYTQATRGTVGKAFTQTPTGAVPTSSDIGLGSLKVGELPKKVPAPQTLPVKPFSRNVPEGYQYAPEALSNTRGAKMFEDTALPNAVIDYIKGTLPREKGMVEKIADTIQGTWKAWKTIWNIAYHPRNLVSNLELSEAQTGKGLARTAIDYVRDIGEYATKADSQLMNEARGARLVKNVNLSQGFEDLLEASRGMEKTSFLKKLLKFPQELQTLMEETSKFSLFKEFRQQGKSIKEAADLAQEAIFSPYRIPKSERSAMRFVTPFYSYTRQAAPFLGKQLVTHPERFTKYQKFETAYNSLSEPQADESQLPDYMKGYLRTGKTNKKGQPTYINPQYYYPWGNFMNETSVLPNLGLGLGLNPFLQEAGQQIFNKDTFTNREIVNEAMPKSEQLKTRVGHAALSLGPALLRSGQKIAASAQGRANYSGQYTDVIPTIVGEITGIREYPFDIQKQLKKGGTDRYYINKEYQTAVKGILKDQSKTPEEKQKLIQAYQQRMRERLQEL